MTLRFLYSKNQEREKLLDIYNEYRWFVDNDFPIVLPKFYAEIYRQNKSNKRIFAKKISEGLNKIYNKKDYQTRQEKIKNNWQKIERDFFNAFNDFRFNIKDKYICYISLYGPQGQFEYPNIISLRANSKKDIKNANETIAHELIHLLIFNKVKKLKLEYEQREGMVDLFFIETKLKNLFPQYKLQSIAVHNKKLSEEINNNKKNKKSIASITK